MVQRCNLVKVIQFGHGQTRTPIQMTTSKNVHLKILTWSLDKK